VLMIALLHLGCGLNGLGVIDHPGCIPTHESLSLEEAALGYEFPSQMDKNFPETDSTYTLGL